VEKGRSCMEPVVVESPSNSRSKGQQWELCRLVDVSDKHCLYGHLHSFSCTQPSVCSEKACSWNAKLLDASPIPSFSICGSDSEVSQPCHITDMFLQPSYFSTYLNQSQLF
jgi:hypothetical protein